MLTLFFDEIDVSANLFPVLLFEIVQTQIVITDILRRFDHVCERSRKAQKRVFAILSVSERVGMCGFISAPNYNMHRSLDWLQTPPTRHSLELEGELLVI